MLRLGSRVVVAAALIGLISPNVFAADETTKYDLLLRGGHVIDPANGINAPMDVAVSGGKIAAVAKTIPADSAQRTVDVTGLYVSPGFIDLHGHIETGRIENGPSFPYDLYLASGATTICDAGTWGARDFHLLKRYYIDRARVRILSFLNIAASGMDRNRGTEVSGEQRLADMDIDLCVATIEKNRDTIVGIKSAHYWTSKPFDAAHPPWGSVDKAVEAGTRANVPIMVDFWPRPERPYDELILKKMRPGDIHTHVFGQQFPIIDPSGKVYEHLWAARKRGVLFDVGHGSGSFWFRNAAPAVKQGFLPDTLGTDLHMGSFLGPVHDLNTVMSKILCLGAPVDEVVKRATVNVAKAIRRPELGTLTVGREADIAVFEVRKGKFGYVDCGRAKMIGDSKLENRLTVRKGNIAYDATGLALVEWQKAPAQYFISPVLQGDPSSSAEPPARRRRNR